MIVRPGAKDGLRAYGGHELTALEVKAHGKSSDILFAADDKVEAFLLESGAKKGGPFSKVGFFGVQEAAKVEKLLEDLKWDALGARDETAIASRRGEEPDALLEFKGAYATVEAKLASFLHARTAATQAESKEAWRRYWGWVSGACLLLAVGIFGLLVNGQLGEAFPFMIFLGVMVGIGSFAGHVIVKNKQAAEADELARGRAIAGAIAQLEADAHPKSKIHGWLDLGDARGTRPYRMANSASSGALKTYHKHHWVRLVFATADGSKLAVSVMDRIKFKSGTEVTRQRQLRGRLEVSGEVYDLRRLAEQFSTQGVDVYAVKQGEKTTMYFGGVLGDPAELPTKLAALYGILSHPVRHRV
jgi:hypothetical protein